MSKYTEMTKAELIQVIKRLEKVEPPRESSAEIAASERERLLQELQVHQAELETQNQELRYMQQRLEESRDRYGDLYDFAPVGYLTFDTQGLIREVNLTGAALLGVERSRVIGMPFSRYVVQSDIPKFRQHLHECQQQAKSVTTELCLKGAAPTSIDVQLISVTRQDAKSGTPLIRSTMMNISERKRAERALADHLEDLQFLSRSGTRLIEPGSSADLFHYTAQQLHAVAGCALILVSEYQLDVNQIRVQAIAGPEEKISRLAPLLGQIIGAIAGVLACLLWRPSPATKDDTPPAPSASSRRHALVAGLVVAQAAWPLLYWPVGVLVAGLVLLGAFYAATGVLGAALNGKPRARAMIEYAAVGLAAIAVVVVAVLSRA